MHTRTHAHSLHVYIPVHAHVLYAYVRARTSSLVPRPHTLPYGERLVSKLHSDAFAKLEHVLLSVEYAFSFVYGLCIWVCSFHLGMLFAFGYNIFIWVCLLHWSMLFSFGYVLCI